MSLGFSHLEEMATRLMQPRPTAAPRHALFALGTPRTPIVAHRVWSSAMDKALTGIDAGKRIIAILGPDGVGKTTLLHEIEHIMGQGSIRKLTVLDDADQLGNEALRDMTDAGTGPYLLAGRPELALELSLIDPTASIISMGRIWQADVPTYLEALCDQTGQTADIIEPAAADRLSAVSSGLPGVLTSVARMSALVAAAAGADRVQVAHVDTAARLYERRETLPTSPAELASLLGADEQSAATAEQAGDSFPDVPEKRLPAGPSRRAIPAVAIATAAVIALAGGALWLARDAGREKSFHGAPPQIAATVPAPGNPPPSRPPSPRPEPAPPASGPAVAQPSAPPPAPTPAVVLPPAEAPALPAEELARPINVDMLPGLAPPRVVVSYAAGSPEAQSKATIVAASLRAHGLNATEPASAQADRDRPGIGFFFFEDREAAAAVQAAVPLALGTPGLLPLTHGEMLPGPGTIDVFIGDDRTAASALRTRAAR